MRSKWKRIVVAISDPDRRTSQALRKGTEIAKRSGARLELLHAYVPSAGLFGTFDTKTARAIAHESLARHRKRMDRLAESLRRRGIEARAEVMWEGPPHEVLARYVLDRKADLLIADSQRRPRLARWFLTNTDWELIRHCPCPLWFAKSGTLRKNIKVLAAVDPFHANAKPARLDDRILAAAREILQLTGGTLAVCHAYVPPVLYGTGSGLVPPMVVPLPPDQMRRQEAHIRKTVTAFAKRYDIPTSARFIEMGDPVSVLQRLTRRLSVDVLVMGAVSRSGLNRLLIGNTAERVIDEVGCDVLVVKPASFRSPAARRR